MYWITQAGMLHMALASTHTYLSKLVQVIILLRKFEPSNLVRELLKEVLLTAGDELW